MKNWIILFVSLFVVTLFAETPYDSLESRFIVNITFEVDMNAETVSAEGVHLAGSFQNWDADETEMFDPDDDGIYAVSVELEAESIVQFRFINGNSWEDEEDVPPEFGVDDGFGGYDRQITVPNEDSTFSYIFGGAPFDNSEVNISILLSSSLRNYPNPFNPTTTISFSIEQNEQVELIIYNLKGQKVKDLSPSLCHPAGAGRGEINAVWDGTNENNKPVSGGIYFYALKYGNRVIAKSKMLLMK